MQVQNMTSNKGNKIANQFMVYDDNNNKYFQSYNSVIVKISNFVKNENGLPLSTVYLDKKYWDYSVTTSKYRNIFLEETKKETQKKIDNGIYFLTDLN
tara:strand:- start:245 stop:538 length:294 start_codon:yes stop_codon:yes gene_type:complete